MSEFDGTPFVAGSVTAIRAFKVDSLGRLQSPQRDHIFTPGVNEAKCGTTSTDQFIVDYVAMTSAIRGYRTGGYVAGPTHTTRTTETAAEAAEPKTHKSGSIGCRCGYYAYYDESEKNAWLNPGCVEAVVEATGTVTHGTKGIRAEKMRVVGVVDPTAPTVKGRRQRWDDFCARVEGKTPDLLGGLYLGVGVLALVFGVALAVIGPRVTGGGLLTLAALCFFGTAVEMRGFTLNLNRRYPLGTQHPSIAAEVMALVRRNYPEVKVYPTRDAMLAAHPTTKPPEPSPDDEDFWTRRT